MSSNEIMNEVVWDKDGNEGCTMTLVKIGAISIVLAAAAVAAFVYGTKALVDLWW